ncbi:hypothetical protein ABID39_001502 [Bartonella japonica]|uniref:Uncharacterized protein n=1 Tax=Bartonella japonica TaxID=357761 RepID=A0ABV2FQE1_9HYPH
MRESYVIRDSHSTYKTVNYHYKSMRCHEDTTVAGRKALNWYHEKWDEKRNIGLGAEHDWSSHGADAFGLMCVSYEQPVQRHKKQAYSDREVYESTSWMAE